MNEQQTEDPVPETIQGHIPAPEEDNDDDLVGIQARVGTDGKKTVEVPLDTIIGLRKGNRDLKNQLKESQAVAARTADVESRLTQAQPIIGAILNNPKLRAEALRIAGGTHTTPETSEQPTDDADAVAFAEDMGFYQGDGVTPDAARGRRALSRLDARMSARAGEAVRPFAGMALNTQAETNLTRAMQMTDKHGAPLATQESIRETAKMLPQHLLANPQVIELVINNAIGLDRRNGRTPSIPDEPVFMDSNSGRGSRGPVVSQEERTLLQRFGISEKDYTASTAKLENAVASRRGINLE